jgi:hypothetical protein
VIGVTVQQGCATATRVGERKGLSHNKCLEMTVPLLACPAVPLEDTASKLAVAPEYVTVFTPQCTKLIDHYPPRRAFPAITVPPTSISAVPVIKRSVPVRSRKRPISIWPVIRAVPASITP